MNWICKCGIENEADSGPFSCGQCEAVPTGRETSGSGIGSRAGRIMVSQETKTAFTASKAAAEISWATALANGATPFVQRMDNDTPENDRDYKE